MSYVSEVLADSPLAYLRMGESSGTTAVDSSGNGRNGTYNGPQVSFASLLTSDSDLATGVQGGIPDAAWMDTTAVTAECWVRFNSITSNKGVVSRFGTGTTSWLLWVDTSSKLAVRFYNAAGTQVDLAWATTPSTAVTYHVVATYTSGAACLYVNGTLVASSATLTGNLRAGDSALQWMQYQSVFQADARFDELAVYGTALSSGRVSAHYAAGTGVASPSLALSGTARTKTASFALTSVGTLALAGTKQARTASFALTTGSLAGSLALSASLRSKVAAFALSPVAPVDRTVSLSAVMQAKIATFTARAIVPVTAAPASVSEAQSVVVAQAFGAVTMHGTQPVYAVSEASTSRARQQIVVDGVDITYLRDVPTPDVTYTLLEPLLYGPATLDLPQVSATFDTFGTGDLAWLRPQAPVEVNLVVDDVVVQAGAWKGFVAAFDINGRTLSVELGGEANGRAAMRDRQVPIFPRINDVGHQMADAVRDLGLPHNPPLGAVTGIETMTTGGTGHLDHINDLVAKSWTRSGKQWTVMPDAATGVYETHRKDATTVHATAFLDDTRTVATLRRDIAEEPNQIFVTCVTPAGMRVRFGKYPGLVQGPVPDFPGSMDEGDSGEGVRMLIGKLHASGYIKLSEVAGGFDADITEAVKDLQDDAGLPQTGVVNLATWRALYDLDVTGLSLEWANIQPAAQRSKTRKYNRSANGTIMGFNDEYDPDVIVRHRSIDLGAGVTRSQAREFAKTVLHDSDAANWVGDITFNTGALIRGGGIVGMALSAANVMDARELRPGMNIWLPQHDGGTLVHVSACQTNGDGIVTATVDTRFRDAMEVWEVIARNVASRNDPSRHLARRYRASTIVKDSIGEYDEFGGFLGVDLPLERGWTVFPLVAAMEGQIREFGIQLDTPGEYAVAVFGKPVDAGWLTDLIPAPLTVTGTRAWEKKHAALKDNWILYSAGTHDEPLGYWPERKTWKSVTGEESNPDYDPTADDNETGTDDDETVTVTTSESTGTVTGKFEDEAGFPYFAFDRKVIWVAVWVRGTNLIKADRLMKPQLEAGV